MFEKNIRTVEHQYDGDMKKWENTTSFEATDRGTKVTQTIEYELPYSVIGKLLDRLSVKKELEEYF
ncbi:MAG: hypothetical protein ACXADF_17875 [Candidatus Thorarchaeota archaeon]